MTAVSCTGVLLTGQIGCPQDIGLTYGSVRDYLAAESLVTLVSILDENVWHVGRAHVCRGRRSRWPV